MKPELPWLRENGRDETMYKMYISVNSPNDRVICIFSKQSKIIIRRTTCYTAWTVKYFPKNHYRKIEEKKAYVELMLRLGEWDSMLRYV